MTSVHPVALRPLLFPTPPDLQKPICWALALQVLRTDICMDLGKSLNPAIDIGQVEGGFVQGMGWACIEELVWGDAQHPWVRPGTLHTRGPGATSRRCALSVAVGRQSELMLMSYVPCRVYRCISQRPDLREVSSRLVLAREEQSPQVVA